MPLCCASLQYHIEGGDSVGPLVRAVVAKWMDKGGCVVDGRRGGADWCSLSADGAGKDGRVHAMHGAAHGVGSCMLQ